MNNQYIQISKDKKWGIFDLNNHSELIPCKYFESSGYLFMTSKIGKKFMFNEYNNLALVDYEHKYGFINKQNIKIIDCKYDFAYPFKNGFCRVMIMINGNFLIKEENPSLVHLMKQGILKKILLLLKLMINGDLLMMMDLSSQMILRKFITLVMDLLPLKK